MTARLENSDIISIKGNRDKWIDFISHIKKNKEKVWDVLETYIDDYIKRNSKKGRGN